MKKILICAVPYSDNLGDGVIAASLAHIAGMKYPEAKVEFLDIAGRVAFDESNLRGGGAFEIFQKMPALLRSAIVFAYCLKNYLLGWRRQWKRRGQRCGSGPHRRWPAVLRRGAELSRQAVSAERVASRQEGRGGLGWRHGQMVVLGKFLVKKFLRNAAPVFYATRDVDSANNLHAFFDIPRGEIKVVPDPALVCASAFSEELSPDKKWDVGICVSSLDALVMNSEYGDTRTSGSAEFFSGLAEALQAEGARVLYFTNGAAEDNKILAEISSSRAAAAGLLVRRSEAPRRSCCADQRLLVHCSAPAARKHRRLQPEHSLHRDELGQEGRVLFPADGPNPVFVRPVATPGRAEGLRTESAQRKNADRRRLDELKTEVIAGTHALI